MTPWIISAVLYVLGGVGLYATACDLNGGPIRTKWKRYSFLVWPVVILIQGGGDIADALDGHRPKWLRR